MTWPMFNVHHHSHHWRFHWESFLDWAGLDWSKLLLLFTVNPAQNLKQMDQISSHRTFVSAADVAGPTFWSSLRNSEFVANHRCHYQQCLCVLNLRRWAQTLRIGSKLTYHTHTNPSHSTILDKMQNLQNFVTTTWYRQRDQNRILRSGPQVLDCYNGIPKTNSDLAPNSGPFWALWSESS